MEDPDSMWEMPSEAEVKTLQARQDRRDKISSLMGEYLLKGYAMLSSACEECSTILLRDREGRNYCVACEEVDTSECAKDDPALNERAARRRAFESRFLSTPSLECRAQGGQTAEEIGDANPFPVGEARPSLKLKLQSADPSRSEAFVRIDKIVLAKMEWAAQQLQVSPSVESSINLCTLVKKCAETLSALHNLQSFGSGVEVVANGMEVREPACTSSTST